MLSLLHLCGGLFVAAMAPHPDEAISTLAGRQHGVVGRQQLLALGMSGRAIERRLASGHLHRVHRGVYAVGYRQLTARGAWMAAVLACGSLALLSHWSAAALWGFTTRSRELHVLSPSPRSRPGIVCHTARNLASVDRSEVARIPVTSPARTLLDLAGVLSLDRLSRDFEEADRLGLVRERAFRDLLERSHGHPGCGNLRTLVDEAYAIAPTRSELEHRFARLCASLDIEQPAYNVLVEGFTVDAFWPRQRLVVELLGKEYHYTRAAVERDRERVARLRLAGYEVLELTWRQVVGEPELVARLLRRFLGAGAES